MVGLIAPAVVAIVLALALGGSLERWSTCRLRWWPLALVALGVQIVLYSPPLNTWPPLVAIGVPVGISTTCLVLLVLLRNAVGPIQPALVAAAGGIGLNLAVMLANGGWMPRADAGVGPVFRRHVDSTISNTAPLAPDSRLEWLADTIVQPAWLPLANEVSPGDLLLSFGVAWWAFALTRTAKPRSA